MIEIGARHQYKEDIIDRWVDTLEKAITLLKIRNIKPLKARMDELIEMYPEVKDYYHIDIADLIGTAREEVTRYFNEKGIYRRKRHD